MRKRHALGAAMIMATTLLGATTTTASAAPSRCGTYFTYSDLHAWGWCDGGTGQFRVVADCGGVDEWGEFGFYAPGPWRKAATNAYSDVWCGSGFYTIRSAWIEVR
ncbi:hypothetical protein [Streptomyces sp. NPDC058579]|uniref:hypothetical protein n=1 Tax=Streptomyces sp. NPDC058579 TaxID=3346548 RepID=UPI00364C44CD